MNLHESVMKIKPSPLLPGNNYIYLRVLLNCGAADCKSVASLSQLANHNNTTPAGAPHAERWTVHAAEHAACLTWNCKVFAPNGHPEVGQRGCHHSQRQAVIPFYSGGHLCIVCLEAGNCTNDKCGKNYSSPVSVLTTTDLASGILYWA